MEARLKLFGAEHQDILRSMGILTLTYRNKWLEGGGGAVSPNEGDPCQAIFGAKSFGLH